MPTPATIAPSDPWPEYEVNQSSVFHYTSSAGLLGMIEEGHLWASEAGSLNDHSEVNVGREYLRKAWKDRPEEIQAVIGKSASELLGQIITGMGSDWWSTGPEGVFVLCASTIADDANQWRLYADLGRGFSVELDTRRGYEPVLAPLEQESPRVEALKQAIGPTPVSPWRSVLYQDDQRDRALRLVLDRIRARSDRADTHPFEAFRELTARADQSRDFDALCQLIKSPGFAGENEARVVIAFRSSNLAENYVHYRASSTGIVRTIHLEQTGHAPSETNRTKKPLLPIKRIIMGPAQRHDLSAPAIHALLARHGYTDVEVEPSQVSLR